MKALTRTRSVGGSLVVTIPKEIVKEESLHEDEIVKLEVKKVKKDYFGITKGFGPYDKKKDRMMGHEF